MKPAMLAILALLVVAVLLLACGSAPSRTLPRDSNMVTRAELEAAHTTNLYDALVVVRPGLLMPRGPGDSILVFWNSNRLGGASTLQTFSVDGVARVRRMSAADATFLFGARATNTTTIQIITQP